MSQIIWAMNPNNDDIENILGYLRKFSLDFFEDSEIQCIMHFPQQTKAIKLSQFIRRNLFLVIKETYHNILKHAQPTEVIVDVALDDETMKVMIKDNGRGFDFSAAKNTGNGINNMQKRMNDIGGTYAIKSGSGSGTETCLEIATG